MKHFMVHDIPHDKSRDIGRVQNGTQCDCMVGRVIMAHAAPAPAESPANPGNIDLVVEIRTIEFPVDRLQGIVAACFAGDVLPAFPDAPFAHRRCNAGIVSKEFIYPEILLQRPTPHYFAPQNHDDGFEHLPGRQATMIADLYHPAGSLAPNRVRQTDIGIKAGIDLRVTKHRESIAQYGTAEPTQLRKVLVLRLFCFGLSHLRRQELHGHFDSDLKIPLYRRITYPEVFSAVGQLPFSARQYRLSFPEDGRIER